MSAPAVGVVLRPSIPAEQLAALARRAEDAGVTQVWLWEDCFLSGGLTAAAAVLAGTERITVGLGLLPVPLRNPALTAMELAVLARLHPGRFLPAVGHGVLSWMRQVGAAVESPITLLREHTAAIRALLAGETVHADGRYVRLDGVALDLPPAQPPPLLVGARGPRTLRLAGELADGVVLDTEVTPDGIARSLAEVQIGRGAADRPFRVVAYTELDATAADLVATVAHRAAELAAAGVHDLVLQPTAADPDPGPLIDACAALG